MLRAASYALLLTGVMLSGLGTEPARAGEAETDAFTDLNAIADDQLAEQSGRYTEDSFNVSDSYNLTQNNLSVIGNEQEDNEVNNIALPGGVAISTTGNISGNSIANTAGLTTVMQTTGHNNAQIYNMNMNITLY